MGRKWVLSLYTCCTFLVGDFFLVCAFWRCECVRQAGQHCDNVGLAKRVAQTIMMYIPSERGGDVTIRAILYPPAPHSATRTPLLQVNAPI